MIGGVEDSAYLRLAELSFGHRKIQQLMLHNRGLRLHVRTSDPYRSAKLLWVARRFDVRENHVTRSSRSLAGLEAVILIAQATAPALIN